MFDLYYANDADNLVRRLAARMRVPASTDRSGAGLLVPEVVLVPQFALRRWLEIRLAEICGIVANVDFFAPAEYAWKLLRADKPSLATPSPFDRQILRWRIFPLLTDLAQEPRFAVLTAALGDAAPSTRLRLATELAQLFERYQAYQRELLDGWERGAEPNDWQAELWRRLTRGITEPHRARLLGDYIVRYDRATATPPGLPPRLFAFGCTNVSPDLLRFYGVVGQHCELGFFMPNPCREYWGDVRNEREHLRVNGGDAFAESDNPLLAAYGRAGRDFVAQIFSYEQVQPSLEQDFSREPERDTLLHRLQGDILDLRAPNRAPDFEPADRSLQFHVCHSRLREVQVLHDQLLDLCARDPSLTPRDIAVMTPDISAYATYIDAVFGGIDAADVRYLRYGISDCAASEAHPLAAFMLVLAGLPLSRRGLDEVMQWFAIPALLRKLDLDLGQLAEVKNWLHAAGVRWGADENQRADVGAGRYREFSWAFGIERLLLGYASGESDQLIAGIAPSAQIEGAAAQMLGVLLAALAALEALAQAQRKSHTPAQWQQIYNQAIDALIDVDGADREERSAIDLIRNALACMAEDAANASLREPIDWQSARDVLREQLGEAEPSYRFLGGGINFCGMVPLRTVPFRVICLLGMNADIFPRRDRVSSLDRLQAQRHPRRQRSAGDRSERDDDRYLFLQLLSAARDVFYLSWIGEDQRDGSLREPSSVISELLDVLGRAYLPATAALPMQHPLQPFSARLFDASDTRLFTYRDEWRAAAIGAGGDQPLPAFVDAVLPALPVERIELDSLRRFWGNPARRFFADRLGLRMPEHADDGEDKDPLELDGLDRYQLIDALAKAKLAARGKDDTAFWRASALLPAGVAGAVALANARIPATELAAAFDKMHSDLPISAPQSFEIRSASGLMLGGTVPEHRDGLICRWSAGRAYGKRLLHAWIDYLALAAQRADASLVLFAWDAKKHVLQTHRLAGIDPMAAKQQLDALMQGMIEGMRRPLLFFPKTSQAYAESWQKSAVSADDAHAKSLDAARRVFETGQQNTGEDEDPACALAVRGLDLFSTESSAAEDFADCARRVFQPLLVALGDAS